MFAQHYWFKFGRQALPGDWKPPHQVFSDVVGLVISACIAIRLALELHRNFEVARLASAIQTILAAKHLISMVGH